MRLHQQPRSDRVGSELRCSGCGQAPGNPIARAEVALRWLVPGPAGPVLARFCRACVPVGPAAVQGWLSGAGWRLVGPVCPDCLGELAR